MFDLSKETDDDTIRRRRQHEINGVAFTQGREYFKISLPYDLYIPGDEPEIAGFVYAILRKALTTVSTSAAADRVATLKRYNAKYLAPAKIEMVKINLDHFNADIWVGSNVARDLEGTPVPQWRAE